MYLTGSDYSHQSRTVIKTEPLAQGSCYCIEE